MRSTVLALGLSLALAAPAFAGAPAPKKPIDIQRFMGRWHEIARTPNANQKGCTKGTMEWASLGKGRFSVVQACTKGSGRKTWKGTATVADARTNAKLQLSLMGGLIKQEYWVLDRADDYSWAIAGTPGGNYVWVLSRKASLTDAERAAVLARVKALGYDTARLEQS